MNGKIFARGPTSTPANDRITMRHKVSMKL